MDIEGITQSEKSQTEKDKHCMILLIWESKNKTKEKPTHRHREQTGGCQGGEEWGEVKLGEGD